MMAALLKEGVHDKDWDPDFVNAHSEMVNYAKDPNPIMWPIPPVEKNVLEEQIHNLLEEPELWSKRQSADVVKILEEFSWESELEPPMFAKPSIDWQALAARVQKLMPPIDYDFECQISVQLGSRSRQKKDGPLERVKPYVWCEDEKDRYDQVAEEVKKDRPEPKDDKEIAELQDAVRARYLTERVSEYAVDGGDPIQVIVESMKKRMKEIMETSKDESVVKIKE
jgi:hypothetical protein